MNIPLERVCEECNRKEWCFQVCNGDGRVHHHGAIHTFEGWLKSVCNDCHQKDKEKWVQAKRGWQGYGKFQQR